jgi:hypothetical protein
MNPKLRLDEYQNVTIRGRLDKTKYDRGIGRPKNGGGFSTFTTFSVACDDAAGINLTGAGRRFYRSFSLIKAVYFITTRPWDMYLISMMRLHTMSG